MDENPSQPTDDSPNEQTQTPPASAQDALRQVSDRLADQAFEPPAPVSDTTAPAKEPEAPAGEPVEETAAEPQPQAEEAPTGEAEAEVEAEEDYTTPQIPNAPALDPKAFLDENGYVDVNKLTESINSTLTTAQATARAAAQAELQAQRLEERAWNQATEKYPQLKTDRTLRDIVQNARIGKTTEMYQRAGAILDPVQRKLALAGIKPPTPAQIAQELFKRMGQAKNEGVISATEQTKIQETAFVDTSNTPEPTQSKTEQLWGKIADPRDPIGAQKAQVELLKHKLFEE